MAYELKGIAFITGGGSGKWLHVSVDFGNSEDVVQELGKALLSLLPKMVSRDWPLLISITQCWRVLGMNLSPNTPN